MKRHYDQFPRSGISTTRIARLALLIAVALIGAMAIPIALYEVKEARRLAAQERAIAAREHFQRHALEPCRTLNSEIDGLLASALGIDPGRIRFAAIVKPAFEAEYGIAVDVDGPRDQVRVVHLDRSHWYTVRAPAMDGQPPATTEKVTATTTLRQLDRAVVDRLAYEWGKSVMHTTDDRRSGNDGVRYDFLTPQGCVTTWVPESGTRPAQLANLVEIIARGGDERLILQGLETMLPSPMPVAEVGPIIR